MGRIISIVNQKGGVGKTATAVNLSASLAKQGLKTLLVDFDPQSNATSGVGIDSVTQETSIYAVLSADAAMDKIILPSHPEGLFVAPSCLHLAGAELELVNLPRRESRLKEALASQVFLFDYIIIDCPPSLGLLTINALTASRGVIVPLQCEYYALEGLTRLTETVEMVRQNLNPSLRLDGIVLTMFDVRNNLSHQVSEEVVRHYGNRVFETVIPRNVRIGEAPSFGKPIILYDPSSRGAQSYLNLAREIVAREKQPLPQIQLKNT